MSVAGRVFLRWSLFGACRQPATEHDLNFLSSVPGAAEFRVLYRESDGGSDSDGFEFYPVRDWARLGVEFEGRRMVVWQFGNFSLCAHSFCVSLQSGAVFTHGDGIFRIANSLDDFLVRYTDGDLALRVSEPWL